MEVEEKEEEATAFEASKDASVWASSSSCQGRRGTAWMSIRMGFFRWLNLDWYTSAEMILKLIYPLNYHPDDPFLLPPQLPLGDDHVPHELRLGTHKVPDETE